MTRMRWIIVLVAAGVGLAILIGVLGTRNEPTKADAATSLCTSLTSLESSTKTLLASTSKSEFQTNLTAVQDDWNQVKGDLQDVKNAPSGQLDSAWDGFTSAVKNVPDAASAQDAVNDISGAAQQLVSTAKSTASQITCSGSGSS